MKIFFKLNLICISLSFYIFPNEIYKIPKIYDIYLAPFDSNFDENDEEYKKFKKTFLKKILKNKRFNFIFEKNNFYYNLIYLKIKFYQKHNFRYIKAFISDSNKTLFFEKIVFKKNEYEKAIDMLFEKILSILPVNVYIESIQEDTILLFSAIDYEFKLGDYHNISRVFINKKINENKIIFENIIKNIARIKILEIHNKYIIAKIINYYDNLDITTDDGIIIKNLKQNNKKSKKNKPKIITVKPLYYDDFNIHSIKELKKIPINNNIEKKIKKSKKPIIHLDKFGIIAGFSKWKNNYHNNSNYSSMPYYFFNKFGFFYSDLNNIFYYNLDISLNLNKIEDLFLSNINLNSNILYKINLNYFNIKAGLVFDSIFFILYNKTTISYFGLGSKKEISGNIKFKFKKIKNYNLNWKFYLDLLPIVLTFDAQNFFSMGVNIGLKLFNDKNISISFEYKNILYDFTKYKHFSNMDISFKFPINLF